MLTWGRAVVIEEADVRITVRRDAGANPASSDNCQVDCITASESNCQVDCITASDSSSSATAGASPLSD